MNYIPSGPQPLQNYILTAIKKDLRWDDSYERFLVQAADLWAHLLEFLFTYLIDKKYCFSGNSYYYECFAQPSNDYVDPDHVEIK